MPDNLNNDYQISTADWRKTLRQNNSRTYMVITLFLLIYAGIGLLLDLYLATTTYPQASLSQLFMALITLQIFPLLTMIIFGVALISLVICFMLYDKLMLLGTEYHEVTPETARNPEEQMLYNIVEEMKIAAGLQYMPRVYIISADYMNAFASGYSEKSAMVAITSGLMQKLTRDEIQAVMAHELSHIRHLDIKLTLTASLLANFSIMILDVLFYSVIFGRSSQDNRSKQSLRTIIIILRYTLPLINILLLMYLSRTRELMADAGAIQLTRNNEPLAKALMKISGDYQKNQSAYQQQLSQTAHENVRRESYLFDPQQAGLASFSALDSLFSTHPTLEARLKAMGFKKNKSD